jgi:hypothetical protein
MSTQNNIYVDVIADIKGFNNLKKGEDSVTRLENRFKSLAKTLGVGLGAAAMVKFGKEAVAAFAADDASAKILANTLSNLGMAFADPRVEEFITKLSEVNGIAKTDLRNSFDALVRSTKSVSKAQDLMNLSLNISKGTTNDLATVTKAISKAYAGNTTSLAKLATGLTKAQLASKDFTKVQGLLTAMFKGDAATAADSYQGKVDRLKTSWEDFKITIGKGIVDAFSNLGKGSNLEVFQSAMSSTAQNIADMVSGLGKVLGLITQIGNSTNSKSSSGWNDALTFVFGGFVGSGLQQLGKNDRLNKAKTALKTGPQLLPFAEGYTSASQHALYLKNQADAAAALAAQNKANKAAADNVKLQNAALLLKKASTIFDLNRISINAALISGAKTLSAEDLARLQLKKDEADVQYAIDTKNADAVDGLLGKMNDALTKVMTLGLQIATMPKAENPLQAVTDGANAATAAINATSTALGNLQMQYPNASAFSNPNFASVPTPAAPTQPPVTVYVNNQVDQNGLTTTITQNQVDNSASGVNPYFQRSGYGSGALAW